MFQPLMEFIAANSRSTDIFCFQEVFRGDTGKDADSHPKFAEFRPKILDELASELNGFEAFFSPVTSINVGGIGVAEGLAIFTRKGIKIDSKGDIPIHKKEILDPESILDSFKAMQYIRFGKDGRNFTVCNFHGVAYPGDKLDNEDRLNQSRKIAEFLEGEKSEKILGGDFNLLPHTESISIIESAGMRNLIKEFKITSTRSETNYKRYRHLGREMQHFADYAFVSQPVKVESFEVPAVDISDHLPLVLQIK